LYGPGSPTTAITIRYVECGWGLVFGAPDAYYSSVSHDDAADAVVAALDLPAGIYKVSDDKPLTRREYLDSLASLLGVSPLRRPPRWIVKLLGSLGKTLARSQRISNHKVKAEYKRIFSSSRQYWFEFYDYSYHEAGEIFYVVGRERGEWGKL
jgi:nucleoside-diphosphate-sugar epimerase